MSGSELLRLGLAEASSLIQRGALSPVDLARAVVAQIERLNPELNAYTTVVPPDVVLAEARAAADEIARGTYRGPLHGIPVGVRT
jgi:Asp-tRNA(Asn)/Glu-tRNA(Gln) amidotransferase A subunit family amidase